MKRITVQLLSLLICLCSICSSAMAYSHARTSDFGGHANFIEPAPASRSSFGTLTLSATTVDPNGATAQGITLTATATDPDGSIAKVEFYAGNALIGFSATAPYSATWPVTAMGTYVLTARATDNVGASTVSSPVTIKVGDGITYLHNDLAGNPIAATDSSGALLWKENFQPYGARLNTPAAAADNRQWFHGKAVDADTGLSYFGARYYDASLGRFMGVDPVGFDPGNLHST